MPFFIETAGQTYAGFESRPRIKPVSKRVKRNRIAAAFIAADIAVTAAGLSQNIRAEAPFCVTVGSTPVAFGRGVEDAVVRTEHGLSEEEIARSVEATRKANPTILTRHGAVTVVQCTFDAPKKGSFVDNPPSKT